MTTFWLDTLQGLAGLLVLAGIVVAFVATVERYQEMCDYFANDEHDGDSQP